MQSLAILDSGAGVAIATKELWDSWGNLALRKTRMKLQLADGFIESPIGLLEKVVVTSCRIEFEHTFAVVDVGKEPNNEIILKRPFMRQMKMIQNWGYDYIYSCQPSGTTCISLKDHSYKDVNYTPIKDVISVIEKTDSLPYWLVHKEPVWLCEVKEKPSNSKEELNGYILEPFPKHEFEPLG